MSAWEDQASAKAQSGASKVKSKSKKAKDEGEDTAGCVGVADFLNSDAFKDLGQEITTNILNDLNGQDTYTCFEDTLKQYEPGIIKEIDNIEIKNKNKKKIIY